jgi:hypothetical protein
MKESPAPKSIKAMVTKGDKPSQRIWIGKTNLEGEDDTIGREEVVQGETEQIEGKNLPSLSKGSPSSLTYQQRNQGQYDPTTRCQLEGWRAPN